MNTTVTKIVHSFTFTTNSPVCWAECACGHTVDVKLLGNVGRCTRCGWEQYLNENGGTTCPCGNNSWNILRMSDAHNPRHQITKMGDTVDCVRCTQYATALEKLKAALAGAVRITHTRCRRAGRIDIYQYDATSPTGCILFMSIDETPEVNSLLTGGLAPLSPTEKR